MSLVEVGGGGWSWVEVDARFSNTLLKEIYGICETKNSTKKQVKEYKMTKREVYKKFTNLIEKESNRQNNKNSYDRNDVTTTIIKRCRGEKKRCKSH